MSKAYRVNHAVDLVPLFLRIVTEARPSWWLMENTPDVPDVAVDGYQVHRFNYDSRWLGKEQHRLRKFQFGTGAHESFTSAELRLSEAIFESDTWERTRRSPLRRFPQPSRRPAPMQALPERLSIRAAPLCLPLDAVPRLHRQSQLRPNRRRLQQQK